MNICCISNCWSLRYVHHCIPTQDWHLWSCEIIGNHNHKLQPFLLPNKKTLPTQNVFVTETTITLSLKWCTVYVHVYMLQYEQCYWNSTVSETHYITTTVNWVTEDSHATAISYEANCMTTHIKLLLPYTLYIRTELSIVTSTGQCVVCSRPPCSVHTQNIFQSYSHIGWSFKGTQIHIPAQQHDLNSSFKRPHKQVKL